MKIEREIYSSRSNLTIIENKKMICPFLKIENTTNYVKIETQPRTEAKTIIKAKRSHAL
jgi:hypothetical protein